MFVTLAFIGGYELVFLLIIVLVLFGSRLPATMKSLGMSVNSFKKGMNEGEEEQDPRLNSDNKSNNS